MIDIKGVSKATLLCALFRFAPVQHIGVLENLRHNHLGKDFLYPTEAEILLEEFAKRNKARNKPDYWLEDIFGRCLFIDITGDEMYAEYYDAHNGEGCAQQAVNCARQNPDFLQQQIGRTYRYLPICYAYYLMTNPDFANTLNSLPKGDEPKMYNQFIGSRQTAKDQNLYSWYHGRDYRAPVPREKQDMMEQAYGAPHVLVCPKGYNASMVGTFNPETGEVMPAKSTAEKLIINTYKIHHRPPYQAIAWHLIDLESLEMGQKLSVHEFLAKSFDQHSAHSVLLQIYAAAPFVQHHPACVVTDWHDSAQIDEFFTRYEAKPRSGMPLMPTRGDLEPWHRIPGSERLRDIGGQTMMLGGAAVHHKNIDAATLKSVIEAHEHLSRMGMLESPLPATQPAPSSDTGTAFSGMRRGFFNQKPSSEAKAKPAAAKPAGGCGLRKGFLNSSPAQPKASVKSAAAPSKTPAFAGFKPGFLSTGTTVIDDDDEMPDKARENPDNIRKYGKH